MAVLDAALPPGAAFCFRRRHGASGADQPGIDLLAGQPCLNVAPAVPDVPANPQEPRAGAFVAPGDKRLDGEVVAEIGGDLLGRGERAAILRLVRLLQTKVCRLRTTETVPKGLRSCKLTRYVRIMPTQQQGPVGQRVARNVRAIRDGMSLRDLSAALDDAGRPILPSGIIKIENGTRRVDADDLAALALALGVTPNRLMLGAEHDSEPVRLTPQVETTANGAWRWACGEHVIRPSAHGAPALRDVVAFMAENRPHAATGDLGAQLIKHRDALQPVVKAARAALAAGVPVGVLLHAMLIADTMGDELPGGGTDGQD